MTLKLNCTWQGCCWGTLSVSLDRQTGVRPSPQTSALPETPGEISDGCFSSYPGRKRKNTSLRYSHGKSFQDKHEAKNRNWIVNTHTEKPLLSFISGLQKHKCAKVPKDYFPVLHLSLYNPENLFKSRRLLEKCSF